MIHWHRLFGLALIDLFAYTNYHVELEKDLSIRQQFLDVVIIEQIDKQQPITLPDGLDNLGKYNLLTYKSFQESLDSWALDELIGHYVNYRKQISPENKLLPVDDFRLYAVTTRYPKKLASEVNFHKLREGVYEIKWGINTIRVLVLNQFPETEDNAIWQAYSAVPSKIAFAKLHYRYKLENMSSLINYLFEYYKMEGVIMPYTVDDYVKDYTRSHLHVLTSEELLENIPVEKRLEGIPPERRLEGISPKQRLEGIPPEQRLEGIPPEQRLEGIPPEQRLKGLSLEEIEAYLSQFKNK